MKELYLNPEMDVVKFSVEDVITTSNAQNVTNPNCENESERGTGFPVI